MLRILISGTNWYLLNCCGFSLESVDSYRSKVLVTGNDITWVILLPLDTEIIAVSIQLQYLAQMKTIESYWPAYPLPDMLSRSVLCMLGTTRRRSSFRVSSYSRAMNLFRCRVA